MTPPAPRFEIYDWAGHSEFLMRFGESGRPTLLIVPPLFEELNRTRKLLSDLMRLLADDGMTSCLPDLPGTGESERLLEDVGWADWQGAVAAATKRCAATHVFSLRGGALLDDAADLPTLRLSPADGKRLIRDLVRARSVTDPDFDASAQKRVFEVGPTLLGGYPVTAALACAVRDAEPAAGNARILRLEGEVGEADSRLAGPPLWRRAEPSGSPALAQMLAQEIRYWTSR